MRTLTARRWRNIIYFILASSLVLVIARIDRANLGHTNFITGWTLFGLTVMLALLNLRKKLPFLRLGTAATWMQFHIYLGLLSLVVFLVHIDFAMPNGFLELILGAVYGLVSLSGLIGLWISRTLPARLTRHGEEVLFERIPAFRTHLREEVEDLVQRAVVEQNSSTLTEFYTHQLQPFLSGTRHFWSHLMESRRPYFVLAGKMRALERYLNTPEREILAAIADRIKTKIDLDYQYAGQALLRFWLFVHIPLTYGLLLFMAAHILVIHAFIGGI